MNGSRIWVLGTAVVAAAIFGLGWLLGISPLLAQAATADEERLVVETQNAAQEQVLAQLRADFERIDELRAELDELREEVPGRPELEDFLDQLTVAAAQTEVVITSATFAEPTGYATPAGGEAAASASADGVYTIGVTLELAGTGDALSAFADAMQRGTRLFVVNGLVISAGGAGSMAGHLFVVADPAAGGPDAPATTSTPEAAPTP